MRTVLCIAVLVHDSNVGCVFSLLWFATTIGCGRIGFISWGDASGLLLVAIRFLFALLACPDQTHIIQRMAIDGFGQTHERAPCNCTDAALWSPLP